MEYLSLLLINVEYACKSLVFIFNPRGRVWQQSWARTNPVHGMRNLHYGRFAEGRLASLSYLYQPCPLTITFTLSCTSQLIYCVAEMFTP
jgi:hypothetical protein